MSIKVYMVNGESIVLESETLNGFTESLGGAKGDYVHYPQEGVVIVVAHVTHAEDPDAMPEVEASDWPG